MPSKSAPVISPVPLDTETLRKHLGLELESGVIVLHRHTLRHVQKRHPEDWQRCLPHVERVLRNPSYVGDDLKNRGKFEFVGRMTGSDFLLVAVLVEIAADGSYAVASFYPVDQSKVEKRRANNVLKVVVRK